MICVSLIECLSIFHLCICARDTPYLYGNTHTRTHTQILINLSITLLVYVLGGCYATVLMEVLLRFYTECCLPSSHHHSRVVCVRRKYSISSQIIKFYTNLLTRYGLHKLWYSNGSRVADAFGQMGWPVGNAWSGFYDETYM